MSKLNKHKALQNWVQEFLTNRHLYFESAESYPNIRTIVPTYGDYVKFIDVLGVKHKSYTFVFVGYESVDTGTSDINTTNMELFDEFNDWLETQQDLENFPYFGDNCSEYEIIPLQNMARVATITEEGIAKYMLSARIEYKEE